MPIDDLRRRRFSTLYAPLDELAADSALLRKRLARRVFRFADAHNLLECIAEHLEDELGLVVHFRQDSIHKWERAFERALIGQILSAVTEAYRKAKLERLPFHYASYQNEINRIFQEEAAAYYLDEDIVVHPKPDEAYRSVYFATIKKLGSSGLEAAVADIKKADKHILEEPPDWARSIYSVFLACENIFKSITGSPRLTGVFIRDDLEPLLVHRYAAEPDVVRDFQGELLNGFYPWVKACHSYRHSPGDVLPSQPPEELALQAICNGYSYARWLADIYAYQQN